MKYIFTLIILTLCSITLYRSDAQAMKATAEDGTKVLLFHDGSWIREGEKTETRNSAAFTKPISAKNKVTGKRKSYEIWFDSKKWQLLDSSKKSNDETEFEFAHIDGDIGAMLIFERIEMQIDGLKSVALENARNVAPDAEIIKEEYRSVNGIEMLYCQIKGTINTISFVYHSYYYVGKAGTIQFVTYTASNLFDDYKKDLDDLLSGLLILKK